MLLNDLVSVRAKPLEHPVGSKDSWERVTVLRFPVGRMCDCGRTPRRTMDTEEETNHAEEARR